MSTDTTASKHKWDKIHARADATVTPSPCYALTRYQHLLPTDGYALDLACGLGGNALCLADLGYETLAIDISSVAIRAIEDRKHPKIHTRCEAIVRDSLEDNRFGIIVVSNYLDRSLCNAITAALAPGGVLVYQTFVQEKANPDAGPSNPEYLLASNELLTLFASLKVLVFSDQGRFGLTNSGFQNQSYLVAIKE